MKEITDGDLAELPSSDGCISAIYLPLGLSEKLDKYDSHIVTGPLECFTETINLKRVPCTKMYENRFGGSFLEQTR